MDQKNDIDLRGAIPETPEMCRDAVLQAVSTYREERYMRKPYKVVLMAAVIVMLLCSTAFALVHFYSVRNYVADGKTSEAFEEAIVPLETTAKSNGLSFTLGDAVFDGKDLAFTMTMGADEGTSPMYVSPKLQAFCGERELSISHNGFGGAYDFGFLLPGTDPNYAPAADQGVNASLFNDAADGPVTWRYTLTLYRPKGELVEIHVWQPASESFETFEDGLRALHAQGKIGCSYGVDIMEYLDAVTSTPIDGTGRARYTTFDERLMSTGMFEPVDTITFEFTTAVPEKVSLTSPTTFDFDGYTVTVKSIAQSFLQVDYELEVIYDEPQPTEHNLEQFYTLTDQNGNTLAWRDALLHLDDDMVTATITGSVTRISDEPLTAITFTLDHNLTIDQDDTAEDMPTFTVTLEK